MHSMLTICFRYTISYVPEGTGRHAYHFSTFYRISRANLALRLRRLWLTPICLQTPHSIKGEYDVSAEASSSNWDSQLARVTRSAQFWYLTETVSTIRSVSMPYPQLNAFHWDRKGNQVPVIPRYSSLVTRTVNKSAALKQLEDLRGFRST
jgi:hypothetical protein